MGRADAFLLEQHLYGRLDFTDSLRTVARVHLDAIPSTAEALWDLGMFALITLHIFSAGEVRTCQP